MSRSSGVKRLQELFEKYDASGDGVLTQDELIPLFEQFAMTRGQLKALLNGFDANKDGVIQIHEFISWLTAEKPKCFMWKKGEGEETYWEVSMLNTSDCVEKAFKLNLSGGSNLKFLCVRDPEMVVQPGQELTTRLVEVDHKGKDFLRPYMHWSCRSNNRHAYRADNHNPNVWRDPDFPHGEASMGDKFSPNHTWCRVRVVGDPSQAVLFDQVRPQDIDQGFLGDCWLMSSLACMAAHPAALKSLFQSRHLSEDGKCSVSIFDVQENEWATVTIDEFVPCVLCNIGPRPIFARPRGEEVWVLLLEKAFAKWCGGYHQLEGGYNSWAFKALTGKTPVSYRKRWGKWQKCTVRSSFWSSKNPRKCQWILMSTKLSNEDFATRLHGFLEDKHVVAASFCNPKYTGEKEATLPNGLINLHGYSILKLVYEQKDDGTPVTLIKIRNPHGKTEWKGTWNDHNGGKDWNENPSLQQRLGVDKDNDGVFWMSFEDFATFYDTVIVCPVGRAPLPEEEEAEEGDEGAPLSN